MGINWGAGLLMATLIVVYFVPSIVAYYRQHHNFVAIVATNVLLGWTALGWIVALIWSLTAIKTPVVVAVVPAE